MNGAPTTENKPPPHRPRHGRVLSLLCYLLLWLAITSPAKALVRFDFEQKYFTHPGRQVWDFSITRAASLYHIFYHTIDEQTPSAALADTIWHATSPDLKHWDSPTPILISGQGPWDAGAIWAPDVFWDARTSQWILAYTGCDAQLNQTICLARSNDLNRWIKATSNPVAAPDTSVYLWSNSGNWSDFRDPYVYYQNNAWQLLATAKFKGPGRHGVIYHGTSKNLETWTDVGAFFVNDGATPWKVLESPQYHVIGTTHHLLFGEFDTAGTTILSAPSPAEWTMANRVLLDFGYAPEIDEFDPGVPIYSRLANYLLPNNSGIGYVVRMDTLLTDPDGSHPSVLHRNPMDANWVVHSGVANIAAPTFGDNPLWRGEPSVGLAGNSYYGSKEYYNGPLSGRGSPGTVLGDGTTGVAETYRFPVTGDRMTLLVGGGNYPATCYVALVDANTGAVLFSETGNGSDTMTPREWLLGPYRGRLCYVTIVDQEYGPMGHINVDEIIEVLDPSGVDDRQLGARPTRPRAWPNPFNPRTTISFDLGLEKRCEVMIHDLSGRLVWRSGVFMGTSGTNAVTWPGRDTQGRAVAAGSYIYSVTTDGQQRASGKITLIK